MKKIFKSNQSKKLFLSKLFSTAARFYELVIRAADIEILIWRLFLAVTSKSNKGCLYWVFTRTWFCLATVVTNDGMSSHPISVAMMTSSNGNIFRVTGLLWGESTGHRWIPLTKASDAELWYFLWSATEQTVEKTIETLVVWDTIALIMTSR